MLVYLSIKLCKFCPAVTMGGSFLITSWSTYCGP